MLRSLTVTRNSIRPAEELNYLALRLDEARRMQADGDHLWVFRHRDEMGVFLEFRESTRPERLIDDDRPTSVRGVGTLT